MAETTSGTRKPRRPNAAYLKKEPSDVHVGFAEYITKTTGHIVAVGDLALVQRLYPLYLKSPAVVKAREAAQAVKDAEKAAKDAEKAERAKARLAKLDAQRAKLLETLGLDDFEVPDGAGAKIIDATDRFTDGKGIEFEKADPDDEEFEEVAPATTAPPAWEDEPDNEPVTLGEITASDSDDDDDDWDDDEEDEEDF